MSHLFFLAPNVPITYLLGPVTKKEGIRCKIDNLVGAGIVGSNMVGQWPSVDDHDQGAHVGWPDRRQFLQA